MDVTIPAGITVTVSGANSLTVPEGVTLTVAGKLDGNGTVSGRVDLAGGTMATTLTHKYELFTLDTGTTYWFDLSGADIPGTPNSGRTEGAYPFDPLPDTTLHYVPFTYAGTVLAYARESAGISTEETVTPDYHSLFIADYVTHSALWDDLDNKGLIFGTSYTSGGVDYTLRAPSVGSKSNGQTGDNIRGNPARNEWDTILNKDSGWIKNWSGIFSLGQDNKADDESSCIIRGGYSLLRSLSYSGKRVQDEEVGFRPVLEVLRSDALQTATLNLNGGSVGSVTDPLNIVYTGETYTAPSGAGLTAPEENKVFNGWKGSDGDTYQPGAEVPTDVSLTAQWDATVDLKDIEGVTAPITGAAALTAIKATDEYTGTVKWDPEPPKGCFAAGTIYTANITLTANEGYTFNGVAANAFKVDGAEATNAQNSGAIRAVFPGTPKATPSQGEGYTIDYAQETIEINGGYEVNKAMDFAPATTVTDGTKIAPGDTLYIRGAADGAIPAGDAVALSIPARPAAPTATGVKTTAASREDGKITDLTAGTVYEISTDGVSWEMKTADDTGTITSLAPGTYQVRLKATASAFASDPAAVVIEKGSGGSSSGGDSGSSSSTTTTPSTPQQIEQAVEKAKDGDTVQVKLPSSGTISKETFERIAGKDVTVEIATSTGVTWLVNGKDIPSNAKLQDLNLSVNTQASTIPVEVVNKITGVTEIRQLELAHTGQFGVTLTLRLDVGQANSGYWANLYYFNPQTQALEYQTAARIGADGNADIPFTHASSYAVVIDTVSHGHPFTDVPENAWYTEAALWAWREGLMVGTTKTTFSPDVATTRGMVVTILWRQAGAPAADYALDFTDVASDAYYAEAVRWAVSQGVAAGYGNGRFGPDDPITREQFAAILYRCAGSPAIPDRVLDFIDAEQISPYAEDTLRWAVSEGLISGKGGGILDPQGEATRAQMAAVLMRYYQ